MDDLDSYINELTRRLAQEAQEQIDRQRDGGSTAGIQFLRELSHEHVEDRIEFMAKEYDRKGDRTTA